jgi:predicted phage baseplate assembly protein
MTDHSCGCCEGTEPLTPLPTANRPGLDALRYRVGTHATFLETMLAGLSSHRFDDGCRPLQRLTTRAPSDPAIAMLDGWAIIGDVLTFYQERIANEGFLRTATERRSVLELARLVGYRLRAGVAASVYLAFTLEQDFEGEVPAGTRAQSIPGPGGLPQSFETSEPLQARARWNAIPPRQTQPSFLELEDLSAPRTLFAKGVATNLRVNDTLLFVQHTALEPYWIGKPYTILEVEPDPAADHTIVTYHQFGAGPPIAAPVSRARAGVTAAREPLTRLGPIVAALRKEPSLPPGSPLQLARPPERTYSPAADLGPRLLTTLEPRLRDTLYTAYANAPVSAAPVESADVHAMRVKAAPFGHNAPQDLVFDDNNVLVGRKEWPLAEFETTLTVGLSSTVAGQTVVEAFWEPANPDDREKPTYPPVRLDLTIADELEPYQFQVDPDDLTKVERAEDDTTGLLYQATFGPDEPFKGVTITVVAWYPSSSSGVSCLAVGFTSTAQTRGVFFCREGNEQSKGLKVTTAGGDKHRNQQIAPDAHVAADTDDGVILSEPTTTNGHVTVELKEKRTLLSVGLEDPLLATDGARQLSLDATYDRIVPGSWVVLHRLGRDPDVFLVEQVREISRADYGITARVTQLVLDRPWLATNDTSLTVVRDTTVYAQSEDLELAEEPIKDDIAGDVIELDGLYDGLEAGRWLVVSGERSDIVTDDRSVEGVPGSELVMLAGVEHKVRTVTTAACHEIELPGDTLHTRLTLSDPLAFRYRREAVAINANVVVATHGETRNEVLGSGDGSQKFQRFTLKQPPLTYVPAPTPAGVASTLEVRVNDIRWQESESLLGLVADTRGYQTTTHDDGKTTIIFGDGTRGARVPTGVENVTAVYRSGIGNAGNVEAKQISLLASRPLGVKEVINPQRASGGADPESRDQARRNAPLATLALDRLVSVDDFASFTRRFAGIDKAAAARLSDGRREIVHVTIAGVDDAPIDRGSDLYCNLLRALGVLGDPSLPLQVALREAVFLVISARVKVHPDYLWEKVEPTIRAALLDVFGFDSRALGQDVLLSELISVIQQRDGVEYVDVDLLEGISETDARDPEALAAKLEELARAASAPPRNRLTVDLARIVAASTGPAMRPAQLAYLNSTLPDTLILTPVTP